MGPARLDSLLALRGIAACTVVFCHVAFLLHRTPPGANFLGAHATLAVELFFIVSAFSLSLSYDNKIKGPDGLSEYALRRALRIIPMFYVLIAAWALFRWSVWSPQRPIGETLANITLVFGLIPKFHTSIVPAGWSIGVECLFYVMFPGLLFVLTTQTRTIIALLLALGLGWSFSVWPWVDADPHYGRMNIISQLPVFLMGMLAYQKYREISEGNKERRDYIARAAMGIGIVIVVDGMLALAMFGNAQLNHMPAYRYFISAGLTLLVLGIATIQPRFIINRVTCFLGTISYSAYLLHPLVISFFQRKMSAFTKSFPQDWLGLLSVYALILWVTVCLAYVTYRYIEKPWTSWGRKSDKSVVIAAE